MTPDEREIGAGCRWRYVQLDDVDLDRLRRKPGRVVDFQFQPIYTLGKIFDRHLKKRYLAPHIDHARCPLGSVPSQKDIRLSSSALANNVAS
jgi:hypothetical protein